MTTLLVVLLFLALFGSAAVLLIRGAANEIERQAEIEEAHLRIRWPAAH